VDRLLGNGLDAVVVFERGDIVFEELISMRENRKKEPLSRRGGWLNRPPCGPYNGRSTQ
jgi:hypothetical protein